MICKEKEKCYERSSTGKTRFNDGKIFSYVYRENNLDVICKGILSERIHAKFNAFKVFISKCEKVSGFLFATVCKSPKLMLFN